MRGELERRHMGKFALLYKSELLGVFDDFNSANCEAERLNAMPFLIRQIGMSDLQKLTDQITSDNRHKELPWGKPVGREVW